MMKKVQYEEGVWFLVPVTPEVTVPGVVARISSTSKGVLLGYFFPNTCSDQLTLAELCELKPSDARIVICFGDMGLRTGEWQILGKCVEWSSRDWVMPNFVREEPLTGRRYEVMYDPDDPGKKLGERALLPEEGKDLTRESLYGHLAVQRYLAHVLGYEVPCLDIKKLIGPQVSGK